MDSVAGKTAVITGGASGIGFAFAELLASEGARVAIADVEQSALTTAKEEIAARGGEVLAVLTDVADPDSMEHLADEVERQLGDVHIVVNNAGVSSIGRTWELPLDQWHWVMDVCFWGVVHGIHTFVPRMITHGQPGHIVNTSSMMGLGAAAGRGPYQAAKHAVLAISEGLAFELELAAPQLSVSVLFPGYVSTSIGSSARNRPDRYGGPSEGISNRTSPTSAVRVTPQRIAEIGLAAILEERFYAPADWEIWAPLVERRFESIISLRNPQPLALP